MQVTKCIYLLAHLHLHLCTSVFAASLRLTTPSPALFSSKPFNVTHKIPLNSSKELSSMQPPEPCYWRPAGSAQILKFYGYGAQIIAWSDVYRSLQRAATDAETHVSDEPMGWWERQYGSVDVRLLLHPGPSMTWGMWKETITGIGHFVTHYQFLDMDFDIVQTGTMVGTGILTAL